MYPLVMTNIAMERSTIFKNGKTIYFYGPSIPWRTVSHNQMVTSKMPIQHDSIGVSLTNTSETSRGIIDVDHKFAWWSSKRLGSL